MYVHCHAHVQSANLNCYSKTDIVFVFVFILYLNNKKYIHKEQSNLNCTNSPRPGKVRGGITDNYCNYNFCNITVFTSYKQ